MTGVSERTISMTVLAILSAGDVLGGTAHADSGLVVTVGTASERERAVVAETFSQAATSIGWTLSSKRPSAKESEALAACKSATPQCVPAWVQSSGIDLVLVVTVNPTQNEGTPSLELVGRAFLTKLQTSTAEKRYCDDCNEDKLKATSVELAEIVLHRLATQSTDTWVEITSDPPGAQIVLDNGREPIGVTNGAFRTFHGTHNVILQRSGYATVQKEFTVKKGETAHLAVPLTATAKETPPPPLHRARPSRVLPGMLVGAGVLAIAGAAILYHYDEDPGPRVGNTYTDTAPAALGLGIGGVLAVGVGVGYYFWRARSGPSSTPSAAIVPGGAVLGWSGSF